MGVRWHERESTNGRDTEQRESVTIKEKRHTVREREMLDRKDSMKMKERDKTEVRKSSDV